AYGDGGGGGRGELDVCHEHCQTGGWQIDRPPEVVDAVRRAVRRQAVARLEVNDALLVALMLSCEDDFDAACRMLDLDAKLARETYARVWRRYQLAAMHYVEETLRRCGRRLAGRFSLH